jgi:hypothetical protein
VITLNASLLPNPPTLDKIALLYSLNRLFISKESLAGKVIPVEADLANLKAGKIYDAKSHTYNKLNVYMLNRSMHQINEACNKLWSTIELHHNASCGNKLCKKFDADFLPSATVPTLHYANISAIISILSLFGLSSVVVRGRRMQFYNLIRTTDGIKLIERNKYLQEVFGVVKAGWHAQVLQTFEGLTKIGIGLPDVNILECRRLQTERSKFHYDILGQTSMKGTTGLDAYFYFLPVVTNTLEKSIQSIHAIIKPIPNGIDGRFEELKNHIQMEIKQFALTS